jgi:hypothetical protein
MAALKKSLRLALSRDLRRPGVKRLVDVVDDAPRKVFTAKADGAVLEFTHQQPDLAFWKGKKHYGSGRTSLIRVPRSQPNPAATAEEQAEE